MTAARVKICGITREQDARAAAESGADAIGLVFYPPSSRYLQDLVHAQDIALAAGPFVTITALFVNATSSEVERVLNSVPVNLLQFHGAETSEECQRYGLPFLKALRVKTAAQVEKEMAEFNEASGLLLDSYVKGQPGGTGETFNWALVPKKASRAIVVAGGLTPENVQSALSATQAYAVDVSGGVESSPGIKDANLIKKFINNAKALEQN